MPQFESQKKSARNLCLSPNKQVTYGETLADAAFTRRQRFDGAAIFELTQVRRSDKEYSGKGTEFATDGQVTGWNTKFGFKAEMDNWLAGWAFAFVMGLDTVTGAGAPYSHAIGFDQSTTQAPGTTIYLEDTDDVKYKINDMAATDLTLTIPERGACMLETNFVGTGRFTQGAMAMALPALAPYAYLLGSDNQFSIGPSGTPLNITGRLMSSTIKIETNAVSHIAPGGALYGQFVRTGLRAMSISATIAAQETDDIFTLFENDTNAGMVWNINSGAQAQLQVTVPSVHLKTHKLGTDGNMIVWQIEADQTTMFSVAGADPLQVEIINATPAYLVGM
jgi:hypothetical protein